MTAVGVLPPGRFNTHIAGQGNCWGAYSQLLPQLDQTAIFNSFNFNLAPDSTTHVGRQRHRLPDVHQRADLSDRLHAAADRGRRRAVCDAQLQPQHRIGLPGRADSPCRR